MKITTLFRRPRTRRMKVAASLGSFLFFLALASGGYLLHLNSFDNFHPVVDGILYRSAQPSAEDIAFYKKNYGIKTIINLRGSNTGTDWYDNEILAAKDQDITHIDFRMSAKREIDQPRAEELIKMLADAPKPVLVHCKSGADRTGLASALYMAAVAKKGEEAAEGQLSFRFGHVAIPFISKAYAMDETFENLESWLGYEGS